MTADAMIRGMAWFVSGVTLGFRELRRVFRGTRHQIDARVLFRGMVFNRLCGSECAGSGYCAGSRPWLCGTPLG